MDKDTQAQWERDILDKKIVGLEAKLNNAQKALWESTLKIHNTMRQLLTANDIRRDATMRTAILEQMNELGRDVVGFFVNAGVTEHTVQDLWPPFKKGNDVSNF